METDVRFCLFSVRFKRLMQEKKFTLNFIAKRLGVRQATVYSWLTGEKIPSLENVFGLCAFLGTTPNYLFGYTI